jgi:hypothetical protein
MIAHTPQFATFQSPAAAIRASKEFDLKSRTVSDAQVVGRTIRSVMWSEDSLALQLDDGRRLSCIARPGRIECSLGDTLASADGIQGLDAYFPHLSVEISRNFTGMF